MKPNRLNEPRENIWRHRSAPALAGPLRRLAGGLLGLALGLLVLAPPRCAAVDPDQQAPCWRSQSGTTYQVWRFDTATNRSPEVVSNPSGTLAGIVGTNGLSAGWISTNGEVYGTAQGMWDLGGTNAGNLAHGTLLLNVPNVVDAASTRYVWVQATVFVESGFFGHPTHIVSNATQKGTSATTLAEGITYDEDLEVWFGWYNRRTFWSIPATGSVNQVILRAAGVGSLVDAVVVDTMLRSPAANDTASTPAGTATNLTATVLANDGGPTLFITNATNPSVEGGTVSASGGALTYTPPANYSGPDVFYYTNSDCLGSNSSAQVTVNVTGGAVTANLDTVTRTQGLPLHISKASLIGNDTGAGLSFAGLNLTSTNGVTLTTNATTIFYTNPNNANDRLTYYVKDNLNVKSGGYVLIQVVPGGSRVVNLEAMTGATNTLTLAGIPNYQYVVQFATNVAGPTWLNLATNTAGTNGQWTVQDTTATNAQRYYRVTTP